MKILLVAILVGILGSASWAGPVDIPNEFESGRPARAAEVNANFAALESAVDDNAAAISDLATGFDTVGVLVRLDGVPVGRYLGFGRPPVEIDLPAPALGSVQVAQANTLGSAPIINVVSNSGYRFALVTSDISGPNLRSFTEGELDSGVVFFDDATCAGNRYFPVEGNTGFFTSYTEGTGDTRPAKPWALRQGVVWASPDPNDTNPVYMIRAGQTAQVVSLLSLLIWAEPLGQPLCIDVTNLPGFDVNDPMHVNNTAFSVEPLDPVEAGVPDRLGGAITVGM